MTREAKRRSMLPRRKRKLTQARPYLIWTWVNQSPKLSLPLRRTQALGHPWPYLTSWNILVVVLIFAHAYLTTEPSAAVKFHESYCALLGVSGFKVVGNTLYYSYIIPRVRSSRSLLRTKASKRAVRKDGENSGVNFDYTVLWLYESMKGTVKSGYND